MFDGASGEVKKMPEGRVPKVGEMVLWKEEGDEDDEQSTYEESEITEVGEIDENTGLYTVETDDGSFTVYWSDPDECWVDSEA